MFWLPYHCRTAGPSKLHPIPQTPFSKEVLDSTELLGEAALQSEQQAQQLEEELLGVRLAFQLQSEELAELAGVSEVRDDSSATRSEKQEGSRRQTEKRPGRSSSPTAGGIRIGSVRATWPTARIDPEPEAFASAKPEHHRWLCCSRVGATAKITTCCNRTLYLTLALALTFLWISWHV